MNRNVIRQSIAIAKDRLRNHPEYDKGGFLHFSFIVVHNKILEVGVNHQGEPPLHYGYEDYSKVHSEVSAYKKARGLLGKDKFEIVNVRFTRSYKLKLSKPCPNCEYLLRQLGCERFFYTTNDGSIKKL